MMINEMEKREVITLCQQLIQEESYSGNEENVAKILKAFFLKNGFDKVNIDIYGNIIGIIKGKQAGKTLLFDGHIDTVPVVNGDKWTYPPFGGEIHENKIYGRGATDMKGAVAAMACAASNFAEACKKDFAGEIIVAGVVHEECFEGVAARKISETYSPDYVIIGEASNLDIKIGQRGRGEVIVETFGIPAHSANPEQGINAVYGMSLAINKIQQIKPPEHPILGKGILELTDIKSSPYPGASVVPDYCRVTYDRRLLVGETKESVLEPIQKALNAIKQEDKSIEVRVSYALGCEKCYTGEAIQGERFFPGWLMDENTAFVQDTLKELREIGLSPKMTYYNFCTNGSHYAGEAKIQTLGLGPSVEKLAHTIDEYIEIEQLVGATVSYMGIMKALLKEE